MPSRVHLTSLRLVRRWRLLGLVAVVAATAMTVTIGVQAGGSVAERCERHAAASAERSRLDTGVGMAVAVIGDSWTVGLGLEEPTGSWPARLPARVHVEGFSGSGFSAGASPCGDRRFAHRVPGTAGAGLVVVAGGLNDVDQPAADIAEGFSALMRGLEGRRVVVVGPAAAPSRAAYVPRVDRTLRTLAERYGVPYVATTGWELGYLPDRLHLSPEGHARFGDLVAGELQDLGLL